MIHVLSKILGRKKSGNNDSNGSTLSCPKIKEGQTIWQKATSLRQSLRHSSRAKVGQKSGIEFSTISSGDKSATLCSSSSLNKSQQPQIRREWGSQRNLARERRSLAAKHGDDLASTKRSLHSRSLCMSGDWDAEGATAVDQVSHLNSKQPRSPRKLTKDSGYETSAQCDPDYANSISDWLSEEKALDQIVDSRSWNKDNHSRDPKSGKSNDKRLEWNTRHRPLSFSHQEVAPERAKSHRQLRHSYSQREVSRHSRQSSIESLANTTDLKKHHAASVESVGTWSGNCPVVTKSTPHLAPGRTQRHSTSSTGSLLQSELDDAAGSNMVTRRFKKGSVYDALASTSGLDFSPVVQLKTYNSRRDDTSPSVQGSKPSDKLWENNGKFASNNSPSKEVFYKDKSESPDSSLSSLKVSSQENKNFPQNSSIDGTENGKCIAAHEKYPSWPVTSPSQSSVSYRSHSWTGQTDYPKEKIVYSRPKKSHQYKISTNQLQPVLERASDYNNSSKNSPESISSLDRNSNSESYSLQYASCKNSAGECNGKQFDFEAFHTPCIPQCYEDKDYRIHSPPERDIPTKASPTSRPAIETPTSDSNGFLSRYEDVLRHQAQYSVPLSSGWNKPRNIENKGSSATPDTPFLDRLRLENAWQMPPPPVPMIPAGLPQQPQQQLQQQLQPQGNDFELSSENGTWMGSMESSSHGRGIPKWQGSYSDLSTLSTQLSNRSSLFDSGHSTMPESGRLSPQSSCDSTAPSLLLEGPTRAQVVARHGCHREIVAHSARVQQPERHGSESVLYYATGSSAKPNTDAKPATKKPEAGASGSQTGSDDAMYRSHASVTLSPSLSKSNVHEVPECQNKTNKCPSRQDSRKSSNSFSSEDSYPRARSHGGDDTSGSSSDISNITCISNYKSSVKSKSLDETSPSRDIIKPTNNDNNFPKYRSGYEPPKSKSMDETTRKFIFPDTDKKQRVSDPELKAIQKQAVMSFYQRMSLAESIKSDQKASASDMEPPPPYEAASPTRMKIYPPKLSLVPKKFKQWEPRISHPGPQSFQSAPKASEPALLNHHSKSVPNLVTLKGQSLDLPPSHPIFKQTYNGPHWNINNSSQLVQKKGSPLAKEEIISWDQLPNVLEKKREAIEKAAPSSENKDPPEDNGGCSSGMHYFKSHKSPRKVQLKEVHHSNETASVKVMTPDGVTLVQTHERKEEKSTAVKGPPHKRRPAPPPPPKQPPKRPPPPPPPVTPPPTQVVVMLNGTEAGNVTLENKMGELKVDVKSPTNQLLSSASSPQLLQSYASSSLSPPSSCCGDMGCPSSPELPLPPPPAAEGSEIVMTCDEPLPPPPEPGDVDVQPRVLDSSSLIYPKNSYMSYRSEKKFGRQGFDGKYRRSFHTSASSVDLTSLGSSFQDGRDGFSLNNWEQIHNIRQHGTTVIFHSDCLQPNSRLQRSNSQDCVLAEEPTPNGTENISSDNLQKSESNQSSTSISTQCSETQGVQLQSVPYHPASHDRIACEVQNSLPDKHKNDFTKVASPKCLEDVVINCEPTTGDLSSSLDNGMLTDDSFVDIESDSSSFTSVDHNQNAVKNNHVDESISKTMNGNDLINRINSATQTTGTPRLRRKYSKTKEELECEQLSMDFINHFGDAALKNLLVPTPNRKTMSDYMEGLLNLDLEIDGNSVHKGHTAGSPPKIENRKWDEMWTSNEKCNALVESKLRSNNYVEMNDNQNMASETELKKRKEELIISIGKKVETLKSEQTSIREEMLQNELLGQEIACRLQKLAKPNELEKYSLHVEEMEKIVNLLLSLSGRLARAENVLRNMPKECSPEEKKILEAKRDKLREQHEDARRLKESIDRRSNQVSTFLHRYFTDDQYVDYDRFIKMKTKLIVDIREIDEKINLGEEQLAALSVVAHLWKSANS